LISGNLTGKPTSSKLTYDVSHLFGSVFLLQATLRKLLNVIAFQHQSAMRRTFTTQTLELAQSHGHNKFSRHQDILLEAGYPKKHLEE
jgi:hypothetical protein